MNRAKRVVAVLLCIQSSVLAAVPAESIGIYHWGGNLPMSASEGVTRIAAFGSHLARIELSPRSSIDYHTSTECQTNASLASLAQLPDFRQAIDNPDVDVFMLTAYDGTTFGDCVHHLYLDPGFYNQANSDAIRREYSDFTLYLYRTYGNTRKRFIISNWESDNDIYCGAAFSYALNRKFRSACDANYSVTYGIPSPSIALVGLRLWLRARQQGIAEGRNRAATEGIGGMRVYFAPEISIVRSLHEAALPSVLYDVLPYLTFDYVSYSAYESINRLDPVGSLTADLDTVRNLTGSTPVILGEIGFSRTVWGDQAALNRIAGVIAAAMASNVVYIFHWNLADQDTINDFGLLDSGGNITALGTWYHAQFKLCSSPSPCQ